MRRWKKCVWALLLFGTAFGYLEAAVVSYLRLLHEPARRRFYPGRPPAELFPLLTLEQVRAAGAEQSRLLPVEVGREAATLVMLAGLALAVAENAGQWAAAFVIAFGVWDITFYLFLKVLLDWPASLGTWDILFLVPVPWAAPVLAPSLVAAAMVGAGVWHLRRESRGEPVRIASWHWTAILTGGAILILSFTLDYPNLLAGAMPRPFHWGVFFLGLGTGLAGYAAACTRARQKPSSGPAVTNVGEAEAVRGASA